MYVPPEKKQNKTKLKIKKIPRKLSTRSKQTGMLYDRMFLFFVLKQIKMVADDSSYNLLCELRRLHTSVRGEDIACKFWLGCASVFFELETLTLHKFQT